MKLYDIKLYIIFYDFLFDHTILTYVLNLYILFFFENIYYYVIFYLD